MRNGRATRIMHIDTILSILVDFQRQNFGQLRGARGLAQTPSPIRLPCFPVIVHMGPAVRTLLAMSFVMALASKPTRQLALAKFDVR